MVCVLLKLTKRVWFDVKHIQFDQTFGGTRKSTWYLHLIVHICYALAAYQARLVKLWSIFGLDIVWAKTPMAIPNEPDMLSKGTQKGKIRYLPHPNLADCNALAISGQWCDIVAEDMRTCHWLIGNLGMLMQENRTADMASDFLLWIWVHQSIGTCVLKISLSINGLTSINSSVDTWSTVNQLVSWQLVKWPLQIN